MRYLLQKSYHAALGGLIWNYSNRLKRLLILGHAIATPYCIFADADRTAL